MCCLCFLNPYSFVVFEIVTPNDVQIKNNPISKFIILYFFYITIRKIQQKYCKTKNNRIITRSSLYSTKIKTLVETRAFFWQEMTKRISIIRL